MPAVSALPLRSLRPGECTLMAADARSCSMHGLESPFGAACSVGRVPRDHSPPVAARGFESPSGDLGSGDRVVGCRADTSLTCADAVHPSADWWMVVRYMGSFWEFAPAWGSNDQTHTP